MLHGRVRTASFRCPGAMLVPRKHARQPYETHMLTQREHGAFQVISGRRKSMVTLLALAVLLLGCARPSDKPRIGVMPKLVGIGYFTAAEKGAARSGPRNRRRPGLRRARGR